jgi:hypothetical protein
VKVRGAEVVPLLRAEKQAVWAVDRHRIAGGLHGPEAERAVGLGGELAAQIHLGLRGVLVLVEAHRG